MKEKDAADADRIDASIFRFILRFTLRQQLLLVLLTLISMPFVYLSLEVPKKIINDAIGGGEELYRIAGLSFTQIEYLLLLSTIFLLLVVFNGVMKYFINVYRGVLGERMLRRIRYMLYARMLRFPYSHSRNLSPGEVIPMVTSETEPLGGYIGDSIALPVFQGGLLITYVSFIFVQDFWLGLAAVALYPPQLWLIPKLQKKVNALSRERIQSVRDLSGRVGETVNAVADIRVNDASLVERADISGRLGKIFSIRLSIFKRKFFIKFLNNFIGQLTPFFFYSIGGYLVIVGQLSLGALVAVLAAYKDIGPPWKELLKFYQITEDVRVKYTQIIGNFELDNLASESPDGAREATTKGFAGSLSANRVAMDAEHHSGRIRNFSEELTLDQHIGLQSSSGDVGAELAMLLAGLDPPSEGSVSVGEANLYQLPESVLGRNIGLCTRDTVIFNRTVRENLLYGLMHRPGYKIDADLRDSPDEREASASGNLALIPDDRWIDLDRANVDGPDQLVARITDVLDVVLLRDEILGLALDGRLEPGVDDALAAQIVGARPAIKKALEALSGTGTIEPFDRDAYSDNLSIAENLLHGTPRDPSIEPADLIALAEVAAVLKESALETALVGIGRQIAALMLELFSDVDAQSELFAQYSFIAPDQLADYQQRLVNVGETPDDEIAEKDRRKFIGLALQLVPARHRLGLITPRIADQILEVRGAIRAQLGEQNAHIQFIESNEYQTGLSIRDNLLFGRIDWSKRHLLPKILARLGTEIEKQGIADPLITQGLGFQCGNAGNRLSGSVRARIALGRALMKNPDILIVNDVSAALDRESQKQLLENVLDWRRGKNLIWTLTNGEMAEHFDRVIVVGDTQVSEDS